MTYPFYDILMVVFILQGFEELQATRYKSKLMAEDGYKPLPFMAYVSFSLLYIMRILVAYLLSILSIPLFVNIWVQFVVTYIVILYVARFLKALLLTPIYKFCAKRQKISENPEE